MEERTRARCEGWAGARPSRRRALARAGALAPPRVLRGLAALGLAAAGLGAMGLGGGCRPAPVQPEPLRVVSVQPRAGQRSYLNEPLVVTFSADLALSSVTHRSARVLHDGTPRPGTWEVEGPYLTWWPRPLLAAGLDDGSLVPGSRHELVLSGFPRPDALRSAAGGQLEATFRHAFEALPRDASPALLDLSMDPGRCEPLRPAGTLPGSLAVLRPGDPVVLECDEPLDPSSLRDADFWVEVDPASPGPAEGAAAGPRAVRVRLVRNEPFRSRRAGACARLEFWPEVPLTDGVYLLRSQPRPLLRDMGGNPAVQELDNAVLSRFRVVSSARGAAGTDLRLEFLGGAGLSPEPLPWADGTARASGEGALRVGFPAAAGDGSDGAVELRPNGPLPAQVEAVRLEVPKGAEVRYRGLEGALVLRSQGSLRVSGSLVREGTPGERDAVEVPAVASSLSSWIEGAVEDGRRWTLLVAGGDLFIEGELRVDTPLVLVAGGRVRVLGSVRCRSEDLFLFGEGGGLGLPGLPGPVPNLIVDAPVVNPLREPLILGAVSSALPEEVHSSYQWGQLEVGLAAGAGEAEVGFLGASEPLERSRLRSHPGLVDAPGPVRMVVELRVLPGERWEPPALDFVHLAWRAGDR